MIRLSAIAVLLAAPLFAQPAAAQDCLCLVGEGFELFDAGSFDAGSFDAGSFEAETPDTTIESTIQHRTGEAATADAGTGTPAHRTVLWCASANDPRCQPMQPSDVPTPRALSSGSVGATLAALTRHAPRFPIAMTMTPSFGLAPSIGVRTALDRPPR